MSSCFLQHVIASWGACWQTPAACPGIFLVQGPVWAEVVQFLMTGITIEADQSINISQSVICGGRDWAAPTQVSLRTELSPEQIMHLSWRRSPRFACFPRGNEVERALLTGSGRCCRGALSLPILKMHIVHFIISLLLTFGLKGCTVTQWWSSYCSYWRSRHYSNFS